MADNRDDWKNEDEDGDQEIDETVSVTRLVVRA